MLRILCSLSLCLLVGCASESEPAGSTTGGTPAASLGESDANVTFATYEAGQTVTMNVPEMHCPFACYPKVKATLAEQPGVESVELVEQKDEAAIDDPRIVVKLNDKFDANQAVAALSEVNFKDSTVDSVE